MVGDRIRLARKKKFTQSELAEKIGVHETTIRRWENGAAVPDATQLIMLATALNTTVSYLTGETDDPKPAGERPTVNASIYYNVNTGNNTATAPRSASIPQAKKIGEETTGNTRFGVYEIDGDEDNPLMMSLPIARWWVPLLHFACITVAEGNQQDIAEALEQVQLITKILERAKTTSTVTVRPIATSTTSNNSLPSM